MNFPFNPEPKPTRVNRSVVGEETDATSAMSSTSTFSRDGFLVWQTGILRLTIGWSALVLAMLVMVGAWWLSQRPGDSDLPGLALLVILMAAAGSTLQAGVHLFLCRLHNSLPHTLVLTAVGFRVVPDGFFGSWLPSQAPNHYILHRLAVQRLFEVTVPPFTLLACVGLASILAWFWSGGENIESAISLTSRVTSFGVIFDSPPQVAVWTWLFQAAWMLLPTPGSHGRTILETSGLIAHYSLGADSSPITIVRLVDTLQSLLGIIVVACGLFLWQSESNRFAIPMWPFVFVLGLLIWSARKPIPQVAGPSQQLDFPPATPPRRRRSNVKFGMMARWRVRRAQKSERAEAMDEVRLDEVLEKLHTHGNDSLTGAERNLLTRVSRRLRSTPKPERDQTNQL